MALEIYEQAYVILGGKLLEEATSVETNIENNDQDVFTLKKGYAGQTPSPKKRVTTVENAQLSTGFEFDFEKAEKESQIVELGIILGGSGLQMLAPGFIRNTRISGGVGQSMTVSFEHHGECNQFQ